MLGIRCHICKELDARKYPKKSRNLHHEYLFELEDNLNTTEIKLNQSNRTISRLDVENANLRKMLFSIVADYHANKDASLSDAYKSAYSYLFSILNDKEAATQLERLANPSET